jgi:hypothetical protein
LIGTIFDFAGRCHSLARFCVMGHGLDQPALLTPTMKCKRQLSADTYIEQIHQNLGTAPVNFLR